jgi:phosphoserine phosphatase RsbU/P
MNCGHNPALLVRSKTGQVETLDSSCPPVGMFEQVLPELSRLEIDTGDVLVFHTDGVTDAANQLEEEFGLQRLTSIVQETSSLSAEEIMRAISLHASEFCQDNGFRDDVTILVVKCEFGKSPE